MVAWAYILWTRTLARVVRDLTSRLRPYWQSRSLSSALSDLRSYWTSTLDGDEIDIEARRPILQHVSSALDTTFGKAVFEFHKTQVFFSISMQIVGLVAIHNISWLGAVTAQQLQIGMAFLQPIGAMGGYTIALILLTLHRIQGQLDWFILALSCCAIAISYGPLLKVYTAELGPDQLQYSGRHLQECGGANPMGFCVDTEFSSIELRGSVGGDAQMLFVGFGSAPICVALFLCAQRYGRRCKTFRRHMLPLLEIYALAGTLYTAVTLCRLLWQTESGSWTLGQILAVAVWAPLYVDSAHSVYRESRSRYDICYSDLRAQQRSSNPSNRIPHR